MSNIVSTKDFIGMKVVDDAKGRKVGKVRRAVFHPSERRCIGFLVKRPDAALMFHRKDLFVHLQGFHVEDGNLVVHASDPKATDSGAVKALGVDWDSCVIWVGMPVMTKSGDFLGYASTVEFDRTTGEVSRVATENGMANDALLGRRSIPGSLVKGFRRGQGMALAQAGQYGASEQGDDAEVGAILVADEVLDLPAEGGAAAAAGKATAVVAHKAREGAGKAKAAVDEKVEKARPAAREAARRTGEAVDAGTFAVGKQLGKASGMFAAFKEEFDKAYHDEGED